ncbi:hypothetical protein Psta_1390 [Pirellula staleyi DSM 6068]|uniref:Uncharacterized protein n=1 Tax=Pirellula staleyi (strain ATCC 27377 / DSM 6068 / ICPB 4128) TaxID=530564 RepID=D2QWW2_PIRSD|nr:hypothetical protein [Pirellula staleyi]ADB16066.1 hypothetical protein Psta_1390 [Pirellula staleyi DSM 6068]
MQRVLRFAPSISVILGIALCSLLVLSRSEDLRRYRVSLAGFCHVALHEGQLVIFNSDYFGPYTGSIVGLGGESYPQVQGGHACGLGAVHLEWPQFSIWTIYVSLFYPLLLTAIAPAIACYQRLLRLAQTGV